MVSGALMGATATASVPAGATGRALQIGLCTRTPQSDTVSLNLNQERKNTNNTSYATNIEAVHQSNVVV